MKRNNVEADGITLIVLIITIIVMLILVSVGTTVGINALNQSKIYKFVTQMQLIQSKVDDIAKDPSIDTSSLGDEVTDTNTIDRARGELTTGDMGNNSDFRQFSTDQMKNQLELDNLTPGDTFLINFKTRAVISVMGVQINGTTYYTQYSDNIPNGQVLVTYVSNVQILNFDYSLKRFGLNAEIVINNITSSNIVSSNLTLSYKTDQDETWTVFSNNVSTGNTIEVPITKSGNYSVRINDVDGKSYVEQNINIKLVNAPKLDTDMGPIKSDDSDASEAMDNGTWYNYADASNSWAYATKDTDVYVWIPRFAYSGTDIEFLKGNTNVPTDNSNIQITNDGANDSDMVAGIFTPNDTGKWVKITEGVGSRGSYNLITIGTP